MFSIFASGQNANQGDLDLTVNSGNESVTKLLKFNCTCLEGGWVDRRLGAQWETWTEEGTAQRRALRVHHRAGEGHLGPRRGWAGHPSVTRSSIHSTIAESASVRAGRSARCWVSARTGVDVVSGICHPQPSGKDGDQTSDRRNVRLRPRSLQEGVGLHSNQTG